MHYFRPGPIGDSALLIYTGGGGVTASRHTQCPAKAFWQSSDYMGSVNIDPVHVTAWGVTAQDRTSQCITDTMQSSSSGTRTLFWPRQNNNKTRCVSCPSLNDCSNHMSRVLNKAHLSDLLTHRNYRHTHTNTHIYTRFVGEFLFLSDWKRIVTSGIKIYILFKTSL